MSNKFNIEDKEYESLIKDDGYFKGFVAAKLISIEKRLDAGDRTFNYLRGQINRNRVYIALGIGGIAVIAFLVKWVF